LKAFDNPPAAEAPGRNARAGYFEDPPSRGGGGFWTVEYYQQYFDVDTKTVRTHCLLSISPANMPM
jgi:hypothetical protein